MALALLRGNARWSWRSFGLVVCFGLLGFTWSMLRSDRFSRPNNTLFLPVIQVNTVAKRPAFATPQPPAVAAQRNATPSLSTRPLSPSPASPTVAVLRVLPLVTPKAAQPCSPVRPCPVHSLSSFLVQTSQPPPMEYTLYLSFIGANRPPAQLSAGSNSLTPPSMDLAANSAAAPNCSGKVACSAPNVTAGQAAPVALTSAFLYLPLVTANPLAAASKVITQGVSAVLDSPRISPTTTEPSQVNCPPSSTCASTNPVDAATPQAMATPAFGYLPLIAVNPPPSATEQAPAGISVQSLSPNTGLTTGGSLVTLTGTGFMPGVTSILFGPNAATSVVCATSTTCTATTPAGSGTVNVQVVVGDQASPVTATAPFTYTSPPPALPNRPTVTSITPKWGAEMGDREITINGEGFVPGATVVNFGPKNPAPTVNCVNSHTCLVVSPPGQGVVDVTVMVATQTSMPNSAARYTYVPAPTLTALNPSTGAAAGGTVFNITGTGFVPGATFISFGLGSPATDVNCSSATTCTATSPAGSGTVDIIVLVDNQLSATSPVDEFTYDQP